jgi:hypothetical protein
MAFAPSPIRPHEPPRRLHRQARPHVGKRPVMKDRGRDFRKPAQGLYRKEIEGIRKGKTQASSDGRNIEWISPTLRVGDPIPPIGRLSVGLGVDR